MKTVVITGGAKGLGAFLTNAFSQEGWRVIVASRSQENSEIGFSENVIFKACNVTIRSELLVLAEYAKSFEGHIDCWINNVGRSAWMPLDQIEEGFLEEMIAVNLKSCFFGSQAASLSLRENGTIINISSLAGKRGGPYNSVYCATKFGVNGLTQSLAKELGSRGIRVNAVCPVYIETHGLNDALENKFSPTSGKSIPDYLESFKQSQSALGRLPKGDEVAKTCLFLASESASAISGQCINVDCGVMPS